MGRRKKKKRNSSVNSENNPAPPAAAESSAPRESKQNPAAESPSAATASGSKDDPVRKDALESEQLEAALRERSPFTGKVEAYDAAAQGLEWEELPLSEEIPQLLGRIEARKAGDDEPSQAKVQVDPSLRRQSESAREDEKEEPPLHGGFESRRRPPYALYALGLAAVLAAVALLYVWPDLGTRSVGADVGANEEAQATSSPATVGADVDSGDGARDEKVPQAPVVALAPAAPAQGDSELEEAPALEEKAEPAESVEPAVEDPGVGDERGPDDKDEKKEEFLGRAPKAPKKGREGAEEDQKEPAEPVAAKIKTRPASQRAAEEPEAKPESTEKRSAAEPQEENAEQVSQKAAEDAAPEPSKESGGAGAVANLTDWKADLKRATGWKNKVEFLREYVDSHPGDDSAMAKLATMLMEMRFARKEADTLAKRAVELNPDNAAAWLVIGYVHQLAGEEEAAQRAYRKCSQCSGPPYYVTECRRLL